MLLGEEGKPISEERRREIFLALVTEQDSKIGVEESRGHVAKRFDISEGQVRKIEKEGLENDWPPL